MGVTFLTDIIALTPEQKSAHLGGEILSADGWTKNGWTGDFTNGFTHTIGSTGRLVYPLSNTGTKTYYLEFDVTSPSVSGAPNASTAFTVTIGNSPRFVTYNGGGSRHYTFGIQSVENGNLEFIPTTVDDQSIDGGVFDGKISNISLKEVVYHVTPTAALKDIDGKVLEEKRFLLDSIYIGKESGKFALPGSELNVALGNFALQNNTTGYWNTAVGNTALRDNTVGSRNVAIGKMALEENICGDRNIGIGTFALCRNKSGRRNIAIGADSLWMLTSGVSNIAFGLASLSETTTGNNNIGIGESAGVHINGNQNIAIGLRAMQDASVGDSNIGIGYWALRKNQANYNLAIGHASLMSNTTGASNIAVGTSALEKNETGNYNVAIGANAGKVTTGSQSVFIGGACGERVTGQKNTLIGYRAAYNLGGGSLNVIIGYNADASAGLQNAIAIGYTATASKSNSVVIGNDSIIETLLKGDLIIRGIDGVKRQIAFNADGSCSWTEVAV